MSTHQHENLRPAPLRIILHGADEFMSCFLSLDGDFQFLGVYEVGKCLCVSETFLKPY